MTVRGSKVQVRRHRTHWLICLSLGLLVTAAVSPAVSANPTAQADWPQYGFDPAHTGYNPQEDTIGVSNVSQLTPAWRGVVRDGINGVSVANGMAYVGADDGRIHVFDANGVTSCSGMPKFCAPLWTGMTERDQSVFSPAVVDGVAYVSSSNGHVYAFDANGVTNCSGMPKRCRPLWHSNWVSVWQSSPTVSNGVLYIGVGLPNSDHGLVAFDATGVTGCSGSPTKICKPLWFGATLGQIASSSTPAVANGVVYIGTETNDPVILGGFEAFDAQGVTNCAGVPKVCDPLWTDYWTEQLGQAGENSPSVANGLVYFVLNHGRMFALDPGTGKTIWNPGSKNANGDVALVNGIAYMGWQDYEVAAFDAAGITNCERGPHQYRCDPLWTGRNRRGVTGDAVAVANGVVYVHSYQSLGAYDAAGVVNCSGLPVICDPLWVANGIDSRPIVVNGMVYAGGTDNDLNVFALP
jgi:outer membrane protein assembly factor BamB